MSFSQESDGLFYTPHIEKILREVSSAFVYYCAMINTYSSLECKCKNLTSILGIVQWLYHTWGNESMVCQGEKHEEIAALFSNGYGTSVQSFQTLALSTPVTYCIKTKTHIFQTHHY